MATCYFAVDVEAAGPSAMHHSMLSFAACMIRDPGITFYRELKPRNFIYDRGSIKIASMGLRCLKGKTGPLDPNNPEFCPDSVLAHLEKFGEDPRQAMMDFQKWLVEHSGRAVRRAMVCDTSYFDHMFIGSYLVEYCGHNMFGHSGISINSYLKGKTNNPDANIKDIRPLVDRGVVHNAEDDVVYLAHQCREAAPFMAT